MTKEEYENYLKSGHWKDVQRWARAVFDKQGCKICGSKHYDIHHLTYDNIGHESLQDLMPLCRVHHNEFHQWLNEHPDKKESDVLEWRPLRAEKVAPVHNWHYASRKKKKKQKGDGVLTVYSRHSISHLSRRVYAKNTRSEQHHKWGRAARQFISGAEQIVFTQKMIDTIPAWSHPMLDFLGIQSDGVLDNRLAWLMGHTVSKGVYDRFAKKNWFQN